MPKNKQFDAVKVSAKTHRILFENDKVRVLGVTIQPGEKEPLHTHSYPSVTITEKPSRIRYYDAQGNVLEEIQVEGIFWLESVGLHMAENVGKGVFRGYRIELK